MKKILNHTLLLLLLGMFSMTMISCNDGSDDEGFSIEDVQAAIQKMKGNYMGTVKYYKIENQVAGEISDPIAVRWKATDTGIEFYDFPFKALSEGINETTQSLYPGLVETLNDYNTVTQVVFTYNNCLSAIKEFAFGIVGEDAMISLNYNDEIHTLRVQFHNITTYSYVQGDQNEQNIQVVITSITLDNRTVPFTPMGFNFTTEKKY